jgi:hypothetical protein
MPTKLPRISVALTHAQHEELTRSARYAGLSLSASLVASGLQASRRGVGLRSALVGPTNLVEATIRGSRGNYAVEALLLYKSCPLTSELQRNSKPPRRFSPGETWIPYAQVGDVAVWETAGPFRVGVVQLNSLEPFKWCDTKDLAVETVRALLKDREQDG